jgi:hyperosmotically inducible protein
MKQSLYALPVFALIAAVGLSACGREDERGAQAPTDQERMAQDTTPATPPATAPGATGDDQTLGAAVDDATITAKVKAALLASDGIDGTDVSVETVGGTVILTGQVKDAQQVQRAAEVAMNVEGVRSVDNRLQAAAG